MEARWVGDSRTADLRPVRDAACPTPGADVRLNQGAVDRHGCKRLATAPGDGGTAAPARRDGRAAVRRACRDDPALRAPDIPESRSTRTGCRKPFARVARSTRSGTDYRKG